MLLLPIQEREYITKSTITKQETTKDDLPLVLAVALVVDYNMKMKQIIPIEGTLKLKDDLITNRVYNTKRSPSTTEYATTSLVEFPDVMVGLQEQATSSSLGLPVATLGLRKWE
jgi:hypothetical protein